ncbi:hypothetical protein [Streptomyces sp. G45]|uniref:hypothetical protein n=1 Tax=Streptomyces sp. G45 TaxID=3406627 RepID=UPI003C1DFDB4
MSPRTESARDDAVRRLSRLIDELGTDGGLITPSVYDTARVASLLPDRPHTGKMLRWLTSQQRPDGGWGAPLTPLARDLPTLAAVLALTSYPAHRSAARRGARFLQRHAPTHWGGPVPQDIPVGLELLLPALLDEARAARVDAPTAPYEALRTLGTRRRRLIARLAPHAPGTAAVHSWEAWGSPDAPLPVDGSTGIGHSPAATATALSRAAYGAPTTDMLHGYLTRATAACPPLMPTVWPIDVFERAWALHALALAGLLHHPGLAPACARQLDLLHASLTPVGIGMSDHFTADGDITATTTAVLTLAGRPCDLGVLDRFRHHDHYRTYPGELQPSLTTTAHAVHALATHARLRPTHGPSRAAEPSRRYLADRQQPDGRWTGDKWHTSWIYTTAQVVIALPHSPVPTAASKPSCAPRSPTAAGAPASRPPRARPGTPSSLSPPTTWPAHRGPSPRPSTAPPTGSSAGRQPTSPAAAASGSARSPTAPPAWTRPLPTRPSSPRPASPSPTATESTERRGHGYLSDRQVPPKGWPSAG